MSPGSFPGLPPCLPAAVVRIPADREARPRRRSGRTRLRPCGLHLELRSGCDPLRAASRQGGPQLWVSSPLPAPGFRLLPLTLRRAPASPQHGPGRGPSDRPQGLLTTPRRTHLAATSVLCPVGLRRCCRSCTAGKHVCTVFI